MLALCWVAQCSFLPHVEEQVFRSLKIQTLKRGVESTSILPFSVRGGKAITSSLMKKIYCDENSNANYRERI